jgi:hypothetical protein
MPVPKLVWNIMLGKSMTWIGVDAEDIGEM